MASDKAHGKVVFVGNIPYDQTEEQILEIFQSVGPVANSRFVFDKETRRPKGYGFVEYHDSETAASAVRNLSNYSLGNRALRVDFSHETSIGATIPPKPAGPAAKREGTPMAPAHLSTPEAISTTLSTFTPQQLLGILQELKTVIQQDAGKARELLKASPPLSYAVVQCMLLMGLVDAQAVAKVVEQAQPARPAPAPAPQRATPPVAQGGADPQKAALIKQVMDLSEEQIAALPAGQRGAIEMLRDKIRRGEY
ncbi:uncharacterized protein V1510DRAFT_383521 [Dipodascopsis tothii]|uniref:uncharacterized protein n=1 Tax=Dipodascopsis tothii TaxID=44089 RepID=UPI0034D005C2